MYKRQGDNHKLNGLEYHRSSEINIAVTDMILLLGSQQDVGTDFTYDTSKVEAFYVPAGTVVEMYATTLHYAPCTAQPGGDVYKRQDRRPVYDKAKDSGDTG